MVYNIGRPYWAQTNSEPIVTPVEVLEPIVTPIEVLEPIEILESHTEPFYIKGIVNGLAATISLWVFWTPFIIFLARPLINAQLKGILCEEFSEIALNYGNDAISTWNNGLSNYLYSLVQTGKINYEQFEQLVTEYRIPYSVITSEQPLPPEIQSRLDNNPQKNWNDNLPLITVFAITFTCVVIFCLTGITTLCQMYNIDSYGIFKFNLVMTLIVVCIEASFFGGVAMRYNPYDLNFAIKELENNVLNMFN